MTDLDLDGPIVTALKNPNIGTRFDDAMKGWIACAKMNKLNPAELRSLLSNPNLVTNNYNPTHLLHDIGELYDIIPAGAGREGFETAVRQLRNNQAGNQVMYALGRRNEIQLAANINRAPAGSALAGFKPVTGMSERIKYSDDGFISKRPGGGVPAQGTEIDIRGGNGFLLNAKTSIPDEPDVLRRAENWVHAAVKKATEEGASNPYAKVKFIVNDVEMVPAGLREPLQNLATDNGLSGWRAFFVQP